MSVAENPGSHDDVRSTGDEPVSGVFQFYAAAHLQTTRPSRQRLARRRIVARSEHDDVAAAQAIASIKFGEPAAGTFGDKVGAQIRRLAGEAAADNLFDLAFMQVDARTEHRISFGRVCAISPSPHERR